MAASGAREVWKTRLELNVGMKPIKTQHSKLYCKLYGQKIKIKNELSRCKDSSVINTFGPIVINAVKRDLFF